MKRFIPTCGAGFVARPLTRWLVRLSIFALIAYPRQLGVGQDRSHIANQPAVDPSRVAPPQSSIEGVVFCDDTGRPARFARVFLFDANPSPKANSHLDSDQAGQSSTGSTVVDPGAETDLDGRFVYRGLRPGEYYVTAYLGGYVSSQFALTRALAHQDAPEIQKAETAMTRVSVSDRPTESVEIRLRRGATLFGAVKYGDGMPAARLFVNILRVEAGEIPFTFGPSGTMVSGPEDAITDDQGHYRISGVPPGKYLVRVQLSTERFAFNGFLTAHQGITSFQFGGRLSLFSGGAFEADEATVYDVKGGDVKEVAKMTISPKHLHVVSGTVAAQSDGHLVNSGDALLWRDRDTASFQVVDVREDGSFEFPYVPDGNYQLEVRAQDSVLRRSSAEPNSALTKDPRCGYKFVRNSISVSGRDLTLPKFVLEQGWQKKSAEPCAVPVSADTEKPRTVVLVHVGLGDSAEPARFASVHLQPIPSSVDDASPQQGLATETGLDGEATFGDVPAGDYYVFAEYPGYVSPLTLLPPSAFQHPTEGVLARAAHLFKRITVEENRGQETTINLAAGGAVEGTVRFDDGAPAADVPVDLLLAGSSAPEALVLSSGRPGNWYFHDADAYTDDLGHYRISGLPPDKYVVRATVPVAGQDGSSLLGAYVPAPAPWHQVQYVYAPSATSPAAAHSFSLLSRGDRGSAGVTISQRSFRTVLGRVFPPASGDPLVYEPVKLESPGDPSFQRAARVATDGTFSFSFIPKGKYVIRAAGGRLVHDGRGSHIETWRADQSIAVKKRNSETLVLKLRTNG